MSSLEDMKKGCDVGSANIDSVITAKEKKVILHAMLVRFPIGQITAILGPSGCGKTTLLDFVTRSISGGAVAKGVVNLPGRSGYVPQGDKLHGFYTCYSYMKHYARLSGLEMNEETEHKIDSILESLGLSTHKHTIVGDLFRRGLSGGQKRRLSVALEALGSPPNLFLDEPTSGLDSESALRLIKFLRSYVRESPGRRVILTIHQPSSFIWKEMENIVLLSQGKLMYQGSRNQIENFFEVNNAPTPTSYNPADHYVTMVNSDFTLHENAIILSPDDWETAFTQWSASNSHELSSPKVQSENIVTPFSPRGNTISRIIELTRRYFKNLILNPGILGTRLAMYTMLSLLIGALFWNLGASVTFTSIQSRIAVLFYSVAFFVFMSVAVLPFTVMERDIVEKEVRNSYYHPAVYQVAQAVASIPGAAILALVTCILICSMTSLRAPLWFFSQYVSLPCLRGSTGTTR